MPIAGGLLAVAELAGATGCTASAHTAQAEAPTATAVPKHPTESLAPLFRQALPNVRGKTFTSAIVDFPPGARAMPHRHGAAFVYAYVLEGTVRSKLDGTPVRTYHQGENWVEQPGAHHVLTENTSRTERAELLVIFVSDTGDRLKADDPQR
ncbi:cupin domain-containing protein [Streptomyces sp. NPDC088178]|uniref:cupin domain-containing protein n=1 Tax=Streptomyces sp. NPDC088178 TaxID=3365836 RepID=UPI0037F676E8